MKNSEYKKKMWTMTLVALVAVGTYVLMFYDMYTTEKLAADSTASLKETEKRVQVFASLRSLQNDIAKDSQLIGSAVGKAGEQVSIIEYIESLGKNAGVYTSIQSVSVDSSETGQVLSLDVLTEGSWQLLYPMMKQVERMQYVASISALKLDKIDSILKPKSMSDVGDVVAVKKQEAPEVAKPGWRATYRIVIPIIES